MKNYSFIALFALFFSFGAVAAESSPKPTLTCSGVSTDGAQMKIVFYGNSGKIESFLNNKLDYDGYAPSSYSTDDSDGSVVVFIEAVNDGLERYIDIEYIADTDLESGKLRKSAWNTMKAYSVKTGKRYTSVDFLCSSN